MKSVQLAHGSGGQAMQQLIGDLFMQAFANPWLAEQEDQARLDLAALAAQGDRLAFSTDSYVIDPLFFPGGNIGKLAVCGTANDVAVSGAIPRYLSCGFILEEGLEMATLEAVVASMADTARAAGVAIVTGDTKVVPRGAADKLFINTAGIGAIPADVHWGTQQISAGDVLLVSGTLGDHGATILNLREQMGAGRRAVQRLRGADAAYPDPAPAERSESPARRHPRRGLTRSPMSSPPPAAAASNCRRQRCRSTTRCAASASCLVWTP